MVVKRELKDTKTAFQIPQKSELAPQQITQSSRMSDRPSRKSAAFYFGICKKHAYFPPLPEAKVITSSIKACLQHCLSVMFEV